MNTEIKKTQLPELLSPAGSEKSVYAAINAGADAIYLGGKQFSARALADNFTDQELEKIIDYCHIRGVRVYITVNTIYKDRELSKLMRFIEKVYTYGADALIVQDIGAAQLIVKNFPDIPLHASTQMTAHSLSDVRFLEESGFCRIVLARELSLTEITKITNETDTEIEIFTHGALCVCYSGRCLMSSFLGGRSGNRGNCAQSCRRFYTLMKESAPLKTGYLLSPKDLIGVSLLGEIITSGVNSIKIEGRMKSPEYVYQVTKTYKTALEAISGGKSATGVSREILRDTAQVFNRGGFTEGYFAERSHSGFPMMSVKSPKSMGVYVGKVISYDYVKQKCKISVELPLYPGDGLEIFTTNEPHAGGGVNREVAAGEYANILVKGNDEISAGDLVYRSYDKTLMDNLSRSSNTDTKKINISGYCRASVGQPFILKLSYDGLTVEVVGEIIQKAEKQPTSSEKILEQLSKTGGTTFKVSFDKYEIDNDIFMSISEINQLRRDATALLEDKIIKRHKMKPVTAQITEQSKKPNIPAKDKCLSVSVMNQLQLDAVISHSMVQRIYLEYNENLFDDTLLLDTTIKRCEAANIELFIALPPIERRSSNFDLLEKTAIHGYLARTWGQLIKLDEIKTNKTIAADYHFNVSNHAAYEYLLLYAKTVCLSQELNFTDISAFADKNAEIIIYGKPVLMTTQQCPVGLYDANKSLNKHCRLYGQNEIYHLKDNANVSFPVITNCRECYAYILNDRPVFMANKMKDIDTTPAGMLRLSFSDEDSVSTAEITELYTIAFGKNNAADAFLGKLENSFTYGHFYRGSL